MSVMVVVLLAGLWALILLPGAWRDRRYASPRTSVDAFEQSMSRLASTPTMPGGHVVVLGRPDRAHPSPPPPAPSGAPLLRSGRPAPRCLPRRPSPRTLQRRRQVLAVLLATTVVTGLAALVVGGLAWIVFLSAYAALFGYLALLAQMRARRSEARQKLAPLHAPTTVAPLGSGVHVRAARGA